MIATWAHTTVLRTPSAPTLMEATRVHATQAFLGTAKSVQMWMNASSTSTVVILTLHAPTMITVLLVHASQVLLAMARCVKSKVSILCRHS